MFRTRTRSRISFLVVVLLVFLLLAKLLALPAIASRLSPEQSAQRFNSWRNATIDNLAKLPEIPIQDFPPMRNTEALRANLRVIQADLPSFDGTDDTPGSEWISPLTYLTPGHFELLGFTNLSLGQIGQRSGVNTGRLPVGDFSTLLGLLTPEKLLEIPAFQGLANRSISEVPLLKSVASKNFKQVGQTLAGDDAGNLSSLTLASAVATSSEFAKTPLNQAEAEVLDSVPVQEALPGLNNAQLKDIPGSSELPLAALSAAGVGRLSLSQMPIPLSLVAGVRIGRADVALGTPREGSREQNRLRIVSGGIPKDDMVLVGNECRGNSCPHFEISSEMGTSAGHGAAWMDSTGQKVKDGFGPLCVPWNCEGPPGNHPFGPAVRVLLKNINQSTGTADVALSFPYCKTIFGKKTCTPWVLPTAEGIPVAKLQENTLVAYIMPGSTVPGEVTNNPFPNPREVQYDEPTPTDIPVPPPQPCQQGSSCVMLNPLPRMTGAGIYSRFRRRRPHHNGVDIQSARGDRPTNNGRVVAPADGVVSFTCNVGQGRGSGCTRYGYAVEIYHPQLGIYTFSAHLYRRLVNQGDRVTRGQQIGIEGGSGSFQGEFASHDHFEVRTRGGANAIRVDPENYRFTSPTMIPPRPTDQFD